MDILNKFDTIIIENDKRITEKDKIFCEKQQTIYNKAIKLFLNFLNEYNSLSDEAENTCFKTLNGYKYGNSCITYLLSTYEIENKINKIQKIFIDHICDIFKVHIL
jgi:hypothetical protein